MQVTEVHQLPANTGAVTACKQYVIRHDDSAAGFSVCFQTSVNHLQEVQLLVGCLEGNIVSGGTLAALLGAKRWVCQNHVKFLELLGVGRKGVHALDVGRNAVQIGVHQGETVRIRHKLHAAKAILDLLYFRIRQVIEGLALGCNPIGSDHKSKGTASRVKALLTELRVDQLGHHVNQHAGREILTGAGFLFVGVLL